MLKRLAIPGLLITSVEPRGGKTVVACAIATTLRAARSRVTVCKPCDTKCVRRREGLVSEDAEFLAACADSPHALDLICPERFSEALPPAFCADRHGRGLDWNSIERAIGLMSRASDIMIIEGSGGGAEPMDAKHSMLEVAKWLDVPVVLVSSATPQIISQTVSSAFALRGAGATPVGIVINRYPAESASVAEEATLRTLERWTHCPVLAIVPDEPVRSPIVPDSILSAIARVDWRGLSQAH